MEGFERTAFEPEPPARPRTPTHVQPLPEFEQLPDDLEPMTPITPVEGLELQPEASVEHIEPAFDLSISDVDVSPLEGLESAADPSQFAIDPEANPRPNPSTDWLALMKYASRDSESRC